MMEVRDPLPAGRRHIQVFYSVVEVHRDAVPEKRRVLLNNVGRRRIAKLPVGADLFELPIERVCLARVQGIAELPDEIGGLDQSRLQTAWLRAILRDWKSRHLDCRRNTRRLEEWVFIETLEYKYL